MADEETQHRVDEIQALIDVSRLITIVDLKKVLSETLGIVAKAVGANKGSLFLLDEGGNPYQRFITQRNMPLEISRVVVSRVLREGLAGWSVRHRQGAIVHDTESDKRWLIFDDDDQTDVRSVICVPFIFEDRVHAVMTLVHDQPNQFTQHDLLLATAIANQASAAIRNAHLFDYVQTQQHQLQIVLENTGEVMFLLSHDLDFVQANSESADLLGIEQSKLIGMNLAAVVGENAMLNVLADRLVNDDKSQSVQVFELHDELTQRDFLANVAHIEDEPQLSYVIVLHDITSMKDLDRLKSHMMRMASHDLKNPLSIIWGYVELMRGDVEAGTMPEMQLINGITRALDRMDKLIDELLDAERLKRESRFRDNLIHPAQIIRQSIVETEEATKRKKQEILENISSDLPPLMGDATQLRQAMINFLTNAIKYTPEGGTITVHASADAGKFHFAVEDTGIGIPLDMQSGIFNQLYRAMRPEIADIEGTGVGLSLVKEIIDRHKGQVWFRSQEGEGSVFGFWIPIQ